MSDTPSEPTKIESKFGIYVSTPSMPRYWDNLDMDVPIGGVTVNILVRKSPSDKTGNEYLVQCPKLPGSETLESNYTPQSIEIGHWLMSKGVISEFSEDDEPTRFMVKASALNEQVILVYPSIKLMAHGVNEFEQLMKPASLEAQSVIDGVVVPIELDTVSPGLSIRIANNQREPHDTNGPNIDRSQLDAWLKDSLIHDAVTHGTPRAYG